MKRIIAFILALLSAISVIFSVSGCEKQKVHIYTRAEWINEIANVFGMSESYSNTPYFDDVKPESKYFNAIQACSEWEIIGKSGSFEPDKRADVTFAIITAVKAIGLDRIAKAVDGRALNSEDEIVKYFNENSELKYISGSSLYDDTAKYIIRDIGVLYSNLQLKQYQDIKLKDNVVTPNESDIVFSADGKTATICAGDYRVGDVICFEPSSKHPEGKYAKIESINGKIIEYSVPSLDEITEQVSIYGTYEPEILGVVPLMDGVDVESIDGTEVESQSYQSENGARVIYLKKDNQLCDAVPMAKRFKLGDIDLKINATAKSGNSSVTVAGGVKLKNIKATVDLDVWGIVVKKAELSVTDTIESSISVSGQLEKTFNIAKVPCKLWGVVGVDFVLAIKIGLEGNVSFVWSVDTAQSIEYKPLRVPKFYASGSNSNLDVELKAKAYIKPEFKAEFVIGPASIANVGAYSGVEASSKTKVVGTSDDIGCVDINAYVPLTIFVGAETKKGDDTLLGKLGVKKSWSLWTSSTSPIKKKWHIEDGEIVPECTRGKKNKEDNNVDVPVDETVIDTDFINQIIDIDKNFVISSYYIALDEGKSDRLVIKSIPDGYSSSDLSITSSDESVATVQQDGIIYASGAGACLIKIVTKDGKYERYCAVRVSASYDVDFTPLSFSGGLYNGIAV